VPVLIVVGGSYAGIHLGDSYGTAGTLIKTKLGDRTAGLLRSSRTPAAVPAKGLLASPRTCGPASPIARRVRIHQEWEDIMFLVRRPEHIP
jgi:hypothetical protein